MVGISVRASGARRCVACCRRSSAGLSGADTPQAADPWDEAADTGRSEALPAAAFARIEYNAYRRHPLCHVTCLPAGSIDSQFDRSDRPRRGLGEDGIVRVVAQQRGCRSVPDSAQRVEEVSVALRLIA